MTDYLIVGQGIAGSMLAWTLQKLGKSFLIIDSPGEASASQVALGVINPVTGRRLALSWKAAAMIPKAWQVYDELEQELGIRLAHRCPIVKTFSNPREENAGMARVNENDWLEDWHADAETQNLYNVRSGVTIKDGGWIEMHKLLRTLADRWTKEQRLLATTLSPDSLTLSDSTCSIGAQTFSKVVFCEGASAIFNERFKPLRFVLSKGEYLNITCQELPDDKIMAQNYHLVPRGNGRFSFGATYEREDLSPDVTQAARHDLEDRLKKLLHVPFEITGQSYGIRPSTYDRRPLMGTHPNYPQLAVFNGLGSKGALMAPWLAEHLVAHLESDQPLDPQVWWLR